MVHGLLQGEESFGGLNDEVVDGALVVFNPLMQRISK